MKNFLELLFCTECCKTISRRSSKHRVLKLVILSVVSLLFLINASSVVILYYVKQNAATLASLVIYAYFFVITACDYFMTAFLEPGDPALCPYKLSKQCGYCHTYRAMRTHHCTICNRCIVKMDHHCAYVENCIGYNNYGQFFALLIWSSITLLFSFCLTLAYLVVITTGEPSFEHWVKTVKNAVYFYWTIISLAITLIFGFTIVKLLFFHVGILSKGETTIEYYDNMHKMEIDANYKEPYDKGVKENFREVIPQPLLLFVPFARIIGDFEPFYTYDYDKHEDLQIGFEFGSDSAKPSAPQPQRGDKVIAVDSLFQFD